MGKGHEREQEMKTRALQTGLPLVYAHMVGAQDEVVFEGGSFALSQAGEVVARAASFEEVIFQITLDPSQNFSILGEVAPLSHGYARLRSKEWVSIGAFGALRRDRFSARFGHCA
jgi:NAD+ synthase (glutamine-hydrolysing)